MKQVTCTTFSISTVDQ